VKSWIIALLLALVPAFSYGQDASQLEHLARIRLHLETVFQLQTEGALSAQQATIQKTKYLGEAAKILKKENLTEEELFSLTDEIKLEAPGTLAKLAGYITLVNIIWVTAAFLLAIAIGWLVFLYIFPLVKELSEVAIEFSSYATCMTIIGASQGLPDVAIVPTAFTGCLLLMGCLYLTEKYHFRGRNYRPYHRSTPRFAIYSGLLFVAWGAAAVFYQSSLIGFIAVGAAVSSLGFSILVTPLCYCIGFEDDAAIIRGTTAAGITVAVYTLIQTTGLLVPEYLELFRTGVMFIGTFVYFIGLLIMASKYYTKNARHYLLMQFLMITSGVAAISVGSIFDITTLQRIGGTIFYLYAIEKYFEIPWGEASWAWITLFFSGLLYGGAWFASANPTYFLF